MVANLLVNIRVALEGLPVTELNGWPNGTVALVWIGGGVEINAKARKPESKIMNFCTNNRGKKNHVK